jgi:hypothetical protein
MGQIDTADPAGHFSQDYFEARERFVAAAADAGARLSTITHPSALGPGKRPVHMDMALLGPPDARDLFVMISGTHGPEGYCGSGVQTGLLRTGIAGTMASRVRVALVHAHNAWGFAWDTRFNEDNIDLNRNYLADFAAPLPANPAYEEIAAAAAPADRSPASLEAAETRLFAFAAAHGFPALQAAISGGQYVHPKGVYFGGHAPSWSNRSLCQLLGEALEGTGRVISVDMHTGLGPSGHGEIITESTPDSDHHRRLESIWPGEIRSTRDGSSVSAQLTGTMDQALLDLAGARWSAVMALEFGTVDPMAVFRATQASSWLHCHGDPEGPDAAPIRLASRAAFYIETDEWKRQVWDRSLAIVGRAAAALGAPFPTP